MTSKYSKKTINAVLTVSALGMISLTAVACAPQTASAVDDGNTYAEEQAPNSQGWLDNKLIYDSDGYPMICDHNGENCKLNPAYNAYRSRDLATNRLPGNNPAGNIDNPQPAPVVPIFTVAF